MGTLKKSSLRKAQSGNKVDVQKYKDQYEYVKEARNAIGKNDKNKLKSIGLSKPYNSNDLSADYSEAQRLRKKAGLGIGEDVKLTLPHVGQQIRGTVNSALGTHFKKGGKVLKKSCVKFGTETKKK